MFFKYFLFFIFLFFGKIFSFAQSMKVPIAVVRIGDLKSPILSSVAVPKDKAFLFTSGLVPSIQDSTATVGQRNRYGDTKIQAISTLKNIEEVLLKEGLSLKDVIFLRAYVAIDKFKDNKADFIGWNEAYGMFFNNEQNTIKTARATLGVHSLVNPDWLIEIEAIAVYP